MTERRDGLVSVPCSAIVPVSARPHIANSPAAAIRPVYYTSRGATLTDRIRRRLGNDSPRTRLERKLHLTGAATDIASVEAAWIEPSIMLSADEAESLVSVAPRLRAIYWQRTGMDGVPVETFQRHGVAVANTGTLTVTWVAETAVSCMLADCKRIPQYARSGPRNSSEQTTAFSALRVGVVGTGRIGRHIGALLTPLGIPTIAFSRSPDRFVDDPSPFSEIRPLDEDFPRRLEGVHYLILACPLTRETLHLVNRHVLDALSPAGVLINLARPDIVDLAALFSALGANRLRSAYLSRPGELGLLAKLQSRRLRNLFWTYNREAHVDGKDRLACEQFLAVVEAAQGGTAIPNRIV